MFFESSIRKNKDRSIQAFTLVELLVVISIIALLLSILMPSLSKARNLAKRVVCGSNMRQVGVSIGVYVAGNDGAMPLITERHWGDKLVPGLAGGGRGWSWAGLLKQTSNIEMGTFRCPADHRKYEITDESFYADPSAYFDYAALFLGYTLDKRVPWSTPESYFIPDNQEGELKMSSIKHSHDVMLVWDGAIPYYSSGSTIELMIDVLSRDLAGPSREFLNDTVFRHNPVKSKYKEGDPIGKGPNCLFADGHVETAIIIDNITQKNVSAH